MSKNLDCLYKMTKELIGDSRARNSNDRSLGHLRNVNELCFQLFKIYFFRPWKKRMTIYSEDSNLRLYEVDVKIELIFEV